MKYLIAIILLNKLVFGSQAKEIDIKDLDISSLVTLLQSHQDRQESLKSIEQILKKLCYYVEDGRTILEDFFNLSIIPSRKNPFFTPNLNDSCLNTEEANVVIKKFQNLYTQLEKRMLNRSLLCDKEEATIAKQKLLDILRNFSPTFSSKANFIPIQTQKAHDIIKIADLQKRSYKNHTAVVYEEENYGTRHVNYEIKFPASSKNHSTAVSTVLAGMDYLKQFSGVAPGLKVFLITEFSADNLDALEKNNARIINMSYRLMIPLRQKNRGPLLERFFRMVEERDMIIVLAAMNFGSFLQEINEEIYEKIKEDVPLDFLTGSFINSPNLQHIFRNIPEIRKRVILVGNLKSNGIFPANTSNLPGDFSSEFIWAPSQDLKSVYFDPFAGTQDPLLLANNYHIPEFNAFGGTSGAAPRVAGALAFLHDKFPDLSMVDLRECLLSGGYPFWTEFDSHFSWLQEASRIEKSPFPTRKKLEKISPVERNLKLDVERHNLTSYGKSVFGRGRLDVESAYYKCFEIQEQKRQHKTTPASLLLEDQKEKQVSIGNDWETSSSINFLKAVMY